jgi:hypothetical protein
MGIAADVARGRHLSLAQATIALAKAAAGNVTSLKRLGIEIPKGTSGMQALRIVAQRYAGQAEAGATAQQRFAATLHTTEELIGTALLPTLDKYLSQLTVWLEKMNESGQLQLKTAAAVRALTDAADAATPALKQMSDAFKIASNHSLGLERALKWALGLPNIFTVGAVAVDDFNHVFGRTKKAADDARVAVGAFIHTIGALPGTTRSPLLPQQNVNVPGIFPDPFADARPLPAVTPRKPFTAIQRNTFFDASLARSLDRVQDIPTLKGQISKLHEISGLVTQRLAITKDITRKLTLEDDLAQIARTIRGDQATIADKEAGDAKTAAEKAKKLAETIAKANKTRLDALATQLAAGQKFTKSFQTLLGQRAQQNQFLALGLTRTGDALAPSKGNLQAELKKVQAGLAGTLFDTDANRNLLSRIRKVLGGQFDALTRETRLKVKELLDALAGDTKGGPATLRSAASISQLIAGTGVQGAALRRLELNLAGAHLTTMPVGRGGAPFVIHTHVHVDKQELGRTVTEVQGVDARRRPVQTRGRQTSSRSL